jgi:hypothetical protein
MADATAPIQPRIAIAEALLARSGQDAPAYNLRDTLNTVKTSIQQVTDAAALRQLLAGVTELQQQGVPSPGRDEVSTVEKVVEIGTKLVGTPTEREQALREELEDMRKRIRDSEETIQKLRGELMDSRRQERREEQEREVTMAQVFSEMMHTFMEWSQRQHQPNENDPLRKIGSAVLESFVNRSPADDLKHVTEVLSSLRELGLLHSAQPQGLNLSDPQVLKTFLDFQLGMTSVQQETQAKIKAAEATAERISQLGPVLGVLGTAILSKVAGDDTAAQRAAQQLLRMQNPSVQATEDSEPAPAPQRPKRSSTGPRLIKCGNCGFEFVTREPLRRFTCPSCAQQMELPGREAEAGEA